MHGPLNVKKVAGRLSSVLNTIRTNLRVLIGMRVL